MSAEADVEG